MYRPSTIHVSSNYNIQLFPYPPYSVQGPGEAGAYFSTTACSDHQCVRDSTQTKNNHAHAHTQFRSAINSTCTFWTVGEKKKNTYGGKTSRRGSSWELSYSEVSVVTTTPL